MPKPEQVEKALEVAVCSLKTIAFQGLSPCSQLAQKALDRIQEIKEERS